MKKYSILLAAVAAAAILGACNKESISDSPFDGKTVLKASLSNVTKTAIDGVKVSWTAGDAINVNGAVSAPIEADTDKATFTFKSALTAPYKAVYPTSIYKDASTISLPNLIEADSFSLPLYGYLESGDEISFKALTALLKISITGDPAKTVKDITLRGLAEEQLSGDFTIDYTSGTLTGTSTGDADKVVKINVGKALSSTPLVFYIPIPAGSYASGYKVEILDTESGLMENSVSARTVKAGELREMPVIAYEPNVGPGENLGGIPNADELKDFAAAVNEGRDLSRWLNASGEVELLADIDLASATEWTPIGDVSATGNGNNASSATGNPFKDLVFNGGNHTIKNFKPSVTIADNKAFGLFGYVQNASVKNLKIETDMTLGAAVTADAGVLAGTVMSSTIENVTVSGKINVTGGNTDNKRFSVGGITGFLFGTAEAPGVIKDCNVTLTATVETGSNTKNGATCVHYGGIVGFATAASTAAEIINTISGCVNDGTITANCGRSSGIVAASNRATLIKDCTNKANHTNSFGNGRIGQIVCNLGAYSAIKDCVNNGDLTTTGNKTTTGGIVALMGDNSTYIEGGSNTGTIITGFDPSTDSSNRFFAGIICANFSKYDHVKDFVVSGKLGKYSADSNHEMFELSAENYTDYIGYKYDSAKMTGLSFVAVP